MARFLLQQDAVFSRVIDAPDQIAAARLGLQGDPIADAWERDWSGLQVTPIDENGRTLYDQTEFAHELLASTPGPPATPPPQENADAPHTPPPYVEL